MISLGIDTSNYATSVAVVHTSRLEVVCAKKEFLSVPQGQCGLRQSDAVFQHTKVLPMLLSELKADGFLSQIDAISVSEKPRPIENSYMPCFLAGVNAATAAAYTANIPLRCVSHQEGHLAAAYFGAGLWPVSYNQPFLFLHFSGGTTELLKIQGCKIGGLLCKSLDLYAGQAVDRLGVKLGFAFPAGVFVSELAKECTKTITPKVNIKNGNCHLSGLENQCERLLQEGQTRDYVAKYCLVFLAHTALGMIRHARQLEGALPVVCAGGVFSSDIIRAEMEKCEPMLHFVPPALSADNAVGVALLASMEE